MTFRFKIFIIASLFLIPVIFFNIIPLYAADLDCTLPENRVQCLTELSQTETDIANLNTQLDGLKGEGVSISRDKKILDTKAQIAQKEIKSHEYSIAKLGKDIVLKQNTIIGLQDKIATNQQGLREVIQKAYQIDNISAVEIFLSNQNISDFFRDMDSYGFINAKIRESIGVITGDKQNEEIQKTSLDQQRNQEFDSKYAIEVQKKQIDSVAAQKATLLALNKKDQANYNGAIATNEAKATKIRNALFALRDSGSIKFEDAVKFAQNAGKVTGVRPAFLLGIFQQESGIGSNLGSCYLKNVDDGSGTNISSGAIVNNVMKPSRDVGPFLTITKALGKDPFTTRVSCPFAVGYGGAMGPAQFIPSTWQLFADRISQANGGGTANPWAAGDAFMAASMYLEDLGAANGSASSERNAACKYYSGSSCGKGDNSFYGNGVMAKAIDMQSKIDLIQ
jgi:membrane-bound lytic murein transglycosylase B